MRLFLSKYHHLLCGCLALLISLMSAAHATAEPENNTPTTATVQAAYIHYFSKYVRWPETHLPKDGPIRITFIAEPDEEVYSAFRLAVEKGLGRESDSTPFELTRIAPEEAWEDLGDRTNQPHILYISKKGLPGFRRALPGISSQSILTISAEPDFVKQGGMIAIAEERVFDSRESAWKAQVQTRIHLGNLKTSGLSISSKLRRLKLISFFE
jgi:hypothetical protein